MQISYTSASVAAAISAGTAFAVLFILKRTRSAKIVRCLVNKSLEGKTALITGAGSGLGFEIASELAKRKARVILAVRNQAAMERVLRDLSHRTRHTAIPDGNLIPMEMDLSSLESVRSFSERFHHRFKSIDILINNAGIMGAPFGHTADGVEMHFGVNHLAHFYLTNQIWDLLSASDAARILVISSGYYAKGHANWPELLSGRNYKPLVAYGCSKLANALHTVELAKRAEGVDGIAGVYCIRPGFVSTSLGRHFAKIWLILGYPLIWLFSKTVSEGVQTYLHCCLGDNLENGALYNNCAKEDYKAELVNDAAAADLWNFSQDLVNQKLPS